MEFKLILKKLNNTLSDEEAIIFREWYNESDLHREYFIRVKENYQDETFLIDIEKGWNAIDKKINPVAVKKTNYLKYAVAASIVLLISITFLFQKESIEKGVNPVVTNNNINIGTDKATLTLEDGTVVDLEKGQQYISDNLSSDGQELVYKDPSTSTKEIVHNYLTIPRGGQYHVILSDGTEIWLNSESQIKYPVTFANGKTRQVELVYGEAYFDVSPSHENGGSKFKVHTGAQEVEVLGTEFNIKAYNDEDYIYTTLVEGKVAINNDKHKKVLKPKEQAVLDINDNNFVITDVDVFSEIAWKRGLFSFKNKPLKDIMKVLSRWYDTDVVFENKSLEHIEFKGVISKNQNIEEILTLIKNTNFINAYDIKNDTILLK
ncbi:FecR family protein [Zobellia sp. B3R18]|uniref:FecR family protein n=1 Tax=Zobellia sp. B3R18 TaxID=2841568 RepID=UPI001C066B25|nr:FecR family protein [Zobellia sp. B3R18]MBU2975098.1 FecR family protein [Zobellia sp. B3R18]